jgi:hypothetical protein
LGRNGSGGREQETAFYEIYFNKKLLAKKLIYD